MSKPTITPWQIQVSDVIDLSSPIAWADRNNAFDNEKMKIPSKNDPHWKIWHQDTNGKYSFNKDSDLTPNNQLRFTYMQTIVDIPIGFTLEKFQVSFSHVDDGARIYVFNTNHPYPNGINDGKVIHGDNAHTADLKSWIKEGKNRIVVVQFDLARNRNTLNNLQIEVNGSPVAAPRLGSLRLVSFNPSSASGSSTGQPDVRLDDRPSVELILDASSSMINNKMEGSKTRWDVAKEVLHKVIDEDLNESMHVAFRVFGDIPSKSEENVSKNSNPGYTTLVQPLAQLNKTTLKEQITKITPYGWTPIAASLNKVVGDLGTASGSRSIVVLITDGNETCGGKVLDAINALNESEVEVVINVVGFAISNTNYKEIFTKWAKAGNGTYYDATDRQLFEDQLIEAINVSYWAKPQEKKGRYTGYIDGPAIDIPAGMYGITVDPEDPDSTMYIKSHEVEAGKLTTVTVERW